MKQIVELLNKEISNSQILIDEPMSAHTSFRIGGPADIFINPAPEDLETIISVLRDKKIPMTILGNGSNVLVGDKGIRGAVISLGSNASDIKLLDNCILVQSGTLVSVVAKEAAKNSLSGLEFASGIPGSIGGAVVMNAGAYGGEMKDCIETVRVLNTTTMTEKTFSNTDCDFSYRHSKFLDSSFIVLDTKLRLEQKDSSQIFAVMNELSAKRKEKQPLEYPSAGSTFKRPEGYFAGKLISDCNLKGFCVGDACVSEKHAGFIVNKKNASAADIKELIEIVSDKVYDAFGVRLEREVRFIGQF